MSTKQKDNFLILIDGTAYLYRAFHALPPLTNKQGENTGAIHGFLKALFKIIEDFAPEHIGLILTLKEKTLDTIFIASTKQIDQKCLTNFLSRSQNFMRFSNY